MKDERHTLSAEVTGGFTRIFVKFSHWCPLFLTWSLIETYSTDFIRNSVSVRTILQGLTKNNIFDKSIWIVWCCELFCTCNEANLLTNLIYFYADSSNQCKNCKKAAQIRFVCIFSGKQWHRHYLYVLYLWN